MSGSERTDLTRREVLQTGAAGAAALSISTLGVDTDVVEAARPRAKAPRWITTWGGSTTPSSPDFPVAGEPFSDETLRQLLPATAGGDAVRLRISNVFGEGDLRIGKARIGFAATYHAGDLIPGSARPLTFDGAQAVTIPPGEVVASDELALTVSPAQMVAVDLYLPETTGWPEATMYNANAVYSTAGDHAGEDSGEAFTGHGSRVGRNVFISWINGLDVRNSRKASGSMATVGDVGNYAWSPGLWHRLRDKFGDRAPGLVDVVNTLRRLVTDSDLAGPSVLSRFEPDILSHTGIKQVAVNVGMTDLIWPQLVAARPDIPWLAPAHDITAAEMMGAYKKLVARGHARGVKVYGCTIMPYKGAELTLPDDLGGGAPIPLWSDKAEGIREEVNSWMRKSRVFDAVFDFAEANQNPLDHSLWHPRYSDAPPYPNRWSDVHLAFAVDLEEM